MHAFYPLSLSFRARFLVFTRSNPDISLLRSTSLSPSPIPGGPCKAIAPKIDELAASLTDKPIEFIKVDVDKLPQLSRTLAISAMPTFKLFHGKDVLGEVVGASYPKIDALVKTGLEKVERETKVECEKVDCEKVECEKVEGEKVECEKPETK